MSKIKASINFIVLVVHNVPTSLVPRQNGYVGTSESSLTFSAIDRLPTKTTADFFYKLLARTTKQHGDKKTTRRMLQICTSHSFCGGDAGKM